MFHINGQQGSKTQVGLIMWLCWPSLSFPPPPHWVGMMAYLNWILSIVSSEITVKGTCAQLDWFSFIIIIFIDTNSPFIRTPRKRVSWLLVRLSLCLFLVRFLGCLELCSNSHMTFPKGCSPWVWPQFTWTIHLAIMRTILFEWTKSKWYPLPLCNMSLSS